MSPSSSLMVLLAGGLARWLAYAFALGYLLGSIPFGLLLTRAVGLGDIRSIGSGNIGATNVLRTGNKKLAAATLLADALKGTLAVLLANGCCIATIGSASMPRMPARNRPAVSNAVVITVTVGRPSFSISVVSWRPHAMHDPQSATPCTTALQDAAKLASTSGGVGMLGLALR